MIKTNENANWHMKARLLKYEEDITPFAKPSFIRHPVVWLKRYWHTRGQWEKAFHRLFTPYEIIEQEGNCLLNSGIDEMWDLITGVVSGADHIFDNTAATIGVGSDATAAEATDTDLIDATPTYKAMEGGYPTSTTQKVTFKSSFGSSDANEAWEEWVVRHATSEICLNRKVESLGTKSTGTWTLEVDITLS